MTAIVKGKKLKGVFIYKILLFRPGIKSSDGTGGGSEVKCALTALAEDLSWAS